MSYQVVYTKKAIKSLKKLIKRNKD